MGWAVAAWLARMVGAAVGGTVRLVADLLSPDPARTHPRALAPQWERVGTFASGVAVWLLGLRIGGVTLGTATTPLETPAAHGSSCSACSAGTFVVEAVSAGFLLALAGADRVALAGPDAPPGVA